jgi:hypothetical protein
MTSMMRRQLTAIWLLGFLTLGAGGVLADSTRGPLRFTALAVAYLGLLAQILAGWRARQLQR